jgi:uncharacterized Zn finger protein
MTSENKAVAAFFTEFPNAPCVHEVAGQLFHDNAEEAAKARAAFYGCAMETTKNPKLINEIMNRVKSELKAEKAGKADVETEIDGNATDVETEIDGNATDVETEIDDNATDVETEIDGNVTEKETKSVKITPEVKPKAPKKSGKRKPNKVM